MEPSHVVDMVLSFGLAGMIFIGLVEKFTPVVPSYVVLMLLGMIASSRTSLVLSIAATAAGSLAGTITWYQIGRAVGARRVERLVARFGKYVFVGPEVYQRLAGAYRRNHFKVTLIGQIVPVARIYLALPAGVFGVRRGAFIAAAAMGILLWNAPFLTLGYALRGVGRDPAQVGFWVSVILVAMEATILLGYRLLSRRPRARNSGSRVAVGQPVASVAE